MYIRADVTVKAKKESVVETKPQYFDISVKEKAERNMANIRVKELLGQHFNISEKAVRIINGHHSPRKLIDIKVDKVV